MQYVIYGILISIALLMLIVAYVFKQRNQQLLRLVKEKEDQIVHQIEQFKNELQIYEDLLANKREQINLYQQEINRLKKNSETLNEEAELLSRSLLRAKEMYEELIHQNNEVKVRLKHAMNEIAQFKRH